MEQTPQPANERPKIRLRPLGESARTEDTKPKWVRDGEVAAAAAANAPAAVAAPPAANLGEAFPELPLTNQHRLIAGIVIAVLMGVGVLVSLKTALLGVAAGVVLAAAISRLALISWRLKVPRQFALWAVCGAALVWLAGMCFAWLPVWRGQAAQFGQQLVQLAQKSPAGKDALVRAASTAESWINKIAGDVVGRRGGWFFQLLLIAGAVAALPVVNPTGAVGALVMRLFSRFGLWCASRLVSATALALVAGIGLSVSGVTAPWFVAGWVFAAGLFVRSVPETTVVLGLVATPWMGDWMRPVVGTVVTGAAMWLAEKKLHWFLFKLPALKEGIILPEMTAGGGDAGAAAPRRSLSGRLMKVGRAALSVAVLAAIAAVLWIFIPPWQAGQERSVAMAKAKSVEDFEEVLVQYPDSREALLGLLKAQMRAGAQDKAIELADRYATWEPASAKAPANWREEIYQKVTGATGVQPASFNRAGGYEFILGELKTWDGQQDLLRDLGQKAVSANAESVTGLRALATANVNGGDLDLGIEYAQRGLKLEPGGTGWHLLMAEGYLAEKEWTKCIAACDAELTLDPNNARVQTMKNVAAMAQKKGLK